MRKSTAMIDQIIRLHKEGHPIRKIAAILDISRNTVRSYIRKEDVDSTQSPQMAISTPLSDDKKWKIGLDWSKIVEEYKKGVSIKVLYEEHEPQISYSHFTRSLKPTIESKTKAAPKLIHKPGERVHIDFCDGIDITDPKSGKLKKTQFFAGVLPFSSFTFGVFCWNQKLSTFIQLHDKMWAYFGGVTPYVVPDNLKSGVKKAHRFDPDVNPTYCDYAHHTGFAVLPARPYTPRDKASVECNIGVVQKTFFQQVRHEKFYSLEELNSKFRSFLNDFNHKEMKDYGVSRSQRFDVEKNKLLQIPETQYQLCEWKNARVHPDCCIQVEKNFYSVPFKYVGQNVRVKLTPNIIEVFDADTNSICCHKRILKQHQHAILDAHLPPTSCQMDEFQVRKSMALAESVGPNTSKLVNMQLKTDRPLRHLRRVLGILRLLERGLSKDSLEYAAGQALMYRRYQLNYFTACAQNYFNNGKVSQSSAPTRNQMSIHLHGGN